MGAALLVSFIGALIHFVLLITLKSANKTKGFVFHWIGVSMVFNALTFINLLVSGTH